MKRKVEHSLSESEDTDEEIKKIANRTLNSEIEEMSDFSIGSPTKKQKGRTVKKETAIETKSPKSPNKSKISGKGKRYVLRYKAPEGFEEAMPIDSDVLSVDLQDQELYLIKAPLNFDIQNLNGVDVNLKGYTELRDNENEFYEVTVTKDKTGELQQFSTVFPSDEGQASWKIGPSFKGQIHVMQSLEVPELPPIAVPEPIVHKVPDGLFPRFQPFGSDDPVISKVSQKDQVVSSDEDHRKSAKKKKKKKKQK